MEFQGVFQTSFTLPTGATSGARIVFDGTSDTILIYDANNNLVESIAAAAGTDPFGNAYPAGYASFGVGFTPIPVVNVTNGIVYEGFIANAGQQMNTNFAASFQVENPINTLIQAVRTSLTNAISIAMGTGTGSTFGSNAPNITIASNGPAALPVDGVIIGALRGGDPINGSATWQNVGTAVPFKANWSSGTAFSSFGGGSGVLRFRRTNEDEGKLTGIADSATGATATIFQLPSGMFNTLNTTFIWAGRNRAGTISWQPIAIDTAGNVMTLAPMAGDQYLFDVTWDIGNIP